MMGSNESDTQRGIKEKLRNQIAENFLMFAGVDTCQDSDSFLELGVIDSTGILELIQIVEGAFNIHVEDHETIPENLDSLNALSAYIMRKTESAGCPPPRHMTAKLPSDDDPS